MKKQSKPKFESIFVLRVYIYGTYGEKPSYQIDEDELKRAGSARSGVDIWCVETVSQDFRKNSAGSSGRC